MLFNSIATITFICSGCGAAIHRPMIMNLENETKCGVCGRVYKVRLYARCENEKPDGNKMFGQGD